MDQVTEMRLTRLALDAIEEAAAASHLGLVPRTKGIALALAWLLHRGGADTPRWPFDNFWQALACERGHDRWSAVIAATNAIYRASGIARDMERASLFEGRIRGSGRPHEGTGGVTTAD